MRRTYNQRGVVATEEQEDRVNTSEAPNDDLPDAAESVETDLIEVNDSAADIEAQDQDVEAAIDAAEALESIRLDVGAANESGGLDQHGATMMNHAICGHMNRAGVYDHRAQSKVSLESFGGSGRRIGSGVNAMEDIKDKIRQIWERIVSALKRAMEWVKDHFNKVFGTAERLKKRADATAERAVKLTGKPKENKLENARLVKALHIGNAAPTDATAARKLSETIGAFGKTLTAVANTGGPALADAIEKYDSDGGVEAAIGAIKTWSKEQATAGFSAAPESDGFDATTPGTTRVRSDELPGGRAVIVTKLADSVSNGEQLSLAIGALNVVVGPYNPKAKEPSATSINTLGGAAAAQVAQAVGNIAEEMVRWRTSLEKLDKVKGRVVKTAGKIVNDAAKDDDEKKRETLNIAGKLGNALPKLLDGGAARLSTYALNTGKALLDWAELSIKQIEPAK